MFLMFPKPKRPASPIHIGPMLVAKVINRDLAELAKANISLEVPCVAPLVDGLELGRCSGRATMQHVKTTIGISVRRIHIEEMLVTLCAGHHLETTAGANWATSHMDGQRIYLSRLYPEFWRTFIERKIYAP